jgi:hypothetical protein
MDRLPRLQVVVSIDGLQPEHDERRKPATYERILKHIEGHQITVHCTVTRQQARGTDTSRSSSISGRPTRHALIWISLYTPQVGELSMERLTPADRAKVIADLRRLRPQFSKLQMLDGMLNVYASRRSRPRSASSLRPRSASRRISNAASRRVSSVESRTARTAAASPRRGSKRSAVIDCVAGCRREDLLCVARGRPHRSIASDEPCRRPDRLRCPA